MKRPVKKAPAKRKGYAQGGKVTESDPGTELNRSMDTYDRFKGTPTGNVALQRAQIAADRIPAAGVRKVYPDSQPEGYPDPAGGLGQARNKGYGPGEKTQGDLGLAKGGKVRKVIRKRK